LIPILGLFEGHLNVSNLDRSMDFFGNTLGLELAQVFRSRRAAFYWIGGRGVSMLGLWETGSTPQRLVSHLAFRVELDNLLSAPERFRNAGITPLDFLGEPTNEPVVLAWMPAAALYFHDPDNNLLEFLTMLPDAPEAEWGVLAWHKWKERHCP